MKRAHCSFSFCIMLCCQQSALLRWQTCDACSSCCFAPISHHTTWSTCVISFMPTIPTCSYWKSGFLRVMSLRHSPCCHTLNSECFLLIFSPLILLYVTTQPNAFFHLFFVLLDPTTLPRGLLYLFVLHSSALGVFLPLLDLTALPRVFFYLFCTPQFCLGCFSTSLYITVLLRVFLDLCLTLQLCLRCLCHSSA